MKVVSNLIGNTPALQQAIRDAGDETQDNVQFLQQRVRDLKKSLERVEHQKNLHLKKMDVLITGDSSEEEIRLFKNEFKSLLQKTTDEKTQLERQIASTERELKTLSQTSFSWSDISSHAQGVQEVMLEKDPVALKRAYYSLFKEIVVGPEDNLGNRTLTYIIKNSDETYEDVFRLRRQMVEAEGIEPSSASDSLSGKATCLVVLLTEDWRRRTTNFSKPVPQHV